MRNENKENVIILFFESAATSTYHVVLITIQTSANF